MDISGTPTSSNIYHVQVYDDGGAKKFRWKLSTDSSYTTGTNNTITANTITITITFALTITNITTILLMLLRLLLFVL